MNDLRDVRNEAKVSGPLSDVKTTRVFFSIFIFFKAAINVPTAASTFATLGKVLCLINIPRHGLVALYQYLRRCDRFMGFMKSHMT